MDKRREFRKKRRVMVKINNKPAVILDASKTGLRLSISSIPSSRNVYINIEDGEKIIQVKGYIRWIKRNLTFSSAQSIGVSIEEENQDFLAFLEKL